MADSTWHQGAIAGCSGAAIAGCHRVGEEGGDQLGRGAIAGCHCSVLWWEGKVTEGRVTANFGVMNILFIFIPRLQATNRESKQLVWFKSIFLFISGGCLSISATCEAKFAQYI